MRYIIEETVVSKTTRLHVVEAPTLDAAEILVKGDQDQLSAEIEKHDLKDYCDITKSPVRQVSLDRTLALMVEYTESRR